MRLTTLLDTLNEGGSGPWPPLTSLPATTPAQGPDFGGDFDQVISSLIPCRQNDAELWFAEREAEVEQAKALCQACPVREGCLAGAIERREPWGVWGGEVFIDGVVVPRKRGRGRPRKQAVA
ncbi:WhiB family transcriptional regulator [Actinotalea sp. M2MS4P-6]|uniref:WhiB family transcriptional regulator n=1 Tax=Actinotalea sp. M2MS4P-6 TaxID=2983762 RepID=UPI0021E36A45|nr:WhiB family transcriptional regulator [Actinotalea sp. M2MS4P-6]MCV2396528.1 WhiB family transcriptional regulator [Actinotalea sp. M2MS4P-6]